MKSQNQQELKSPNIRSFLLSTLVVPSVCKAVFVYEKIAFWKINDPGPIWGKYNSCWFWLYGIYSLTCCGSLRSGIRHFILIHSRTLCCSKATAGILLKNAWVEVAVGFANRFSTKNHCGLGYYLQIALIWFLLQFRGTRFDMQDFLSYVVFGSFFPRSFQMNLKIRIENCWIYSCLQFGNRRLILKVSVH